MAENIIEKAAEGIVSSGPQFVGDLVAQLLPRQYQTAASFVVSEVAFEILKTVFDVAVSQGMSFNAMSLTLKQIQNQLEELDKKVETLLRADWEAAKTRLPKAMNYLKELETYEEAYEEFEKILDLSTRSLSQVADFEVKVMIT